MKFSIATVCLSGDLKTKLQAASVAGYRGIEIFENDLIAYGGSPFEISQIAADLGLEIIALQPFRDFEGMPQPQRKKNFERAKRKFELMNVLGTKRILVCSNTSDYSIGDENVIIDDLFDLGELASNFGVAVGYEALAWGKHVSDYRQAWHIVEQVNHGSVEIILDNWHIMSRKLPLDDILEIPRHKIAFVQLADAPAVTMDLLAWSRHFRCFPGQGDWNVDSFIEALLGIQYEGWLSHEVFNDRFRMASPERTAVDGERSLILLTKKNESGRVLADSARLLGFCFLKLRTTKDLEDEISSIFQCLGWKKIEIRENIVAFRQGKLTILVERESFTESAQEKSSIVESVGILTDHLSVMKERSSLLKADILCEDIDYMSWQAFGIQGIGDTRIFFVQDNDNLINEDGGKSDIDNSSDEICQEIEIDHISYSVMPEQLPSWRLFYRSIFDLYCSSQVDVIDPHGLIESQAIQSSDGKVRICLNCSSSQNTLPQKILKRQNNGGIQHIAFLTDDIFELAVKITENESRILQIPENYYNDLEARLDLSRSLADRMRALNILYDEDENGVFYHFYTDILGDQFFIEFVQRDGYLGYGASNSGVRVAAQNTKLKAISPLMDSNCE